MNIKTEAMPAPVKYIVTLDPDDVETRKKECYDKVKSNIEIPSFRKGNVPRDVAESRLRIERLYKPMVDQIFHDIVNVEPNIVSSADFKFFGDLKKKSSFTIEFVAEIKPLISLPVLNAIKIEKPESILTENEFRDKITMEVKKSEIILDSEKESLENFDIAVIDFEGRLEGEATPFKGGVAKGYQIKINEIINGQKQFIDNFEDQLIGMKKEETRQIFVTFPTNYRETTLAGKKAIFTVTLKAIKDKIIPEYNEQFAKSKGFDTIKLYEENLRLKFAEEKENNAKETFKKQVLLSVINNSNITPIPKVMIDRENEKEWNAFLKRIGKTEEQIAKEKVSKEGFFDHYTQRSIESIKAALVLEQVAKDFGILVTDDEIVTYAMQISSMLKHDVDRQTKIKEELKTNKQQFELMRTAALNEKTIEFLLNEVK